MLKGMDKGLLFLELTATGPAGLEALERSLSLIRRGRPVGPLLEIPVLCEAHMVVPEFAETPMHAICSVSDEPCRTY